VATTLRVATLPLVLVVSCGCVVIRVKQTVRVAVVLLTGPPHPVTRTQYDVVAVMAGVWNVALFVPTANDVSRGVSSRGVANADVLLRVRIRARIQRVFFIRVSPLSRRGAPRPVVSHGAGGGGKR
jgi:hypothetical protein